METVLCNSLIGKNEYVKWTYTVAPHAYKYFVNSEPRMHGRNNKGTGTPHVKSILNPESQHETKLVQNDNR